MNPIKLVISIITVFLALALGLNSYTTVPAGHNKVKTYFGKVQDVAITEGFHFVNPLEDFTVYDLRDQTYTWNKIEVPSQDKLKSTMDVSVTFRLKGSATPNMKMTVGDGDNVLNTYITPKVRSVLREVGKTVEKSQDFFQDTTQLEMQTYVEDSLKAYLEPKGVEIVAVLFKDITLPAVVTAAVIQTKKRQEELEQEKAQLKIVEQKAQQQVKQAIAADQAAESTANAVRKTADGEAYKIAAEATAQAEANRKLAKSLTKELIEYRRIEAWNGVYPTTMLTSGGNSGGPSILLGLNK